MSRRGLASTSKKRALKGPASMRHVIAALFVSAALLLQSLAPPGYMAGSIDAGWPVVLCPEGLPSGFLSQGHAHHHDETGGAEDLSLDGHCPLGSVAGASVALAALSPEDRLPRLDMTFNPYPAPLSTRDELTPPSRGPPA